MNNIVLLTHTSDQSPIGGREMLCKLSHDFLKQLSEKNCITYELPKKPISGLKSIIQAFSGYIDGLTSESVADIIQFIQAVNVNKIFVDGSNFGGFVKIVKNIYPEIKIYTFFHNVESKFFLDSLKESKTPRALAVLIVNYLAERKSVKYSDHIICINNRDSQLLKKVYGKSATDFYAMSLEDKLPLEYTTLPSVVNEKFALFVGGTFYANKVGIFWFVENVVPYIKIKTYIVGRGFEKFKNELEAHDNVVVVGEVDSLAQWYHDAYFVIAPIFDGSGMKTKVAEALMYGKKIIGTTEAFTGYESITEQVGNVCKTADEFISAINSSDKMVDSIFDKELRRIYEDNYSFSAAQSRLESIMNQ
jgi:glycosyltransferase involved in cell wall biosynthesis